MNRNYFSLLIMVAILASSTVCCAVVKVKDAGESDGTKAERLKINYSPVMADRNPIFDKNATPKGYWEGLDKKGAPPTWELLPDGVTMGFIDLDKTSNSASHQRDGQNVLFNDSHVGFELAPNCGIDKDNIWKFWAGGNLDNPSLRMISASETTWRVSTLI